MNQQFIKKYRRYLAILDLFSPIISHSLNNTIAVRLGKHLSPRLAEHDKICDSINRYLDGKINTESAWNSFLMHSCISDSNMFYYDKIDKKWLETCVEIQGQDYIDTCVSSGTGLLIMTYHHHYNLLFCICIGLMGYRANPIAMNPSLSPLHKPFQALSGKIYGAVEARLNGEKILYVEPGKPAARPILRALEQGNIVITVNDFPNKFAEKRQMSLPFFDGDIICPFGSLEIAMRKKVRLATSFLKPIKKNRFRLTIRPVVGDSIEEVMRQYAAHLEDMVMGDPGLWGGWRFS